MSSKDVNFGTPSQKWQTDHHQPIIRKRSSAKVEKEIVK